MPTIQVDITDIKRTKDNVIFTAKTSNNVITREIDISEFDTWEKFASWLINQNPDFVLVPDKQKSLSVTFHTETVVDPESGAESQVRVVDGVTVL